MTILKRCGKIEKLSAKKIYDSIYNANSAVEKTENRLTNKQIKRITDSVVAFYEDISPDKQIHIDELEDLIEKKMMEAAGYDTAKRYITYRYEKERVRNTRYLTEKLTASNVQNQNANIDEFSFGGRIGETAGFVTKQYALEHLLSQKAKQNHLNNEIYIHDLDNYAVGNHNCLSIPFDKLLAEGFNTRQTDVRPASSINTAFQLVAVIFQLQSLQQFGGVAATHLDWTMVPYVRKSFWKHFKDGLKYIEKWTDEELDAKFCNITSNFRELSIEKTEILSLSEDCSAYDYAYDKTVQELEQAVEGMYHNLNTLQSRSGNQLPFTSINYGTCTLPEGRMVIKALLDGSIKGCGKFHKTSIFPCGIFQCMKGVNRKPGDPNYDLFRLALKSTAMRIYPNYANCDFSGQLDWVKFDREAKQKIIDDLSKNEYNKLIEKLENNPELKDILMLDVVEEMKKIIVRQEQAPTEIMSTMGCRTQNGADINFVESYKKNIKQVIYDGTLYDDVTSAARKDGRGNICPVTLILPELAMQAKEKAAKIASKLINDSAKDGLVFTPNYIALNVEEFMKILDKKINEAKDMLLERFDWICSQPAKSAKFMYENGTMYGYKPEEGIRSALKHGTLAVGQLGLAEALQILIGKDHTTEEGMQLAIEIEILFKDKCAKFKKDYKLNFGVYYTPSETLSHTALVKFREKYGIIQNVSDREYFTNSMHVPVWHKIDAFTKIDLESKLTGYSSAGCITYVEIDSSLKNNVDAMETLVNYAMDHDIPYFALNCKIDTCSNCGYQDEIPNTCPKCGANDENIQRLRRVTGYITGNYKTAFNIGKQDEVKDRAEHTGIEI